MTIFYFAYGSNMLASRLTERVPGAKAVGRAALAAWVLDFSKRVKMVPEKQISPQNRILSPGAVFIWLTRTI